MKVYANNVLGRVLYLTSVCFESLERGKMICSGRKRVEPLYHINTKVERSRYHFSVLLKDRLTRNVPGPAVNRDGEPHRPDLIGSRVLALKVGILFAMINTHLISRKLTRLAHLRRL